MNNDLLKKIKNRIYSKPLNNYYNRFYNTNKNYNNNILTNLLDNNKLDDDDKNIMISELDIKLNNSDNDSQEKRDIDKPIINNQTEPKIEFKKQLTENIIKYLQKNNNDNSSFTDSLYNNKNDIISKAKKALNLTSITPSNKGFKTITINKNNDDKINKKNYFIKINRKLNTNKKKAIITNSNKKKEFIIKKMKNKNFKSFFEKFNNNTYKKIKNNNTIYNQPRKSLLLTGIKKSKNMTSFNTEYKKTNISNIKFKKNTSFLKDINRSNTLRNSFKNSMAKIKNTFKQLKTINNSHIHNKKKLNSNSKPKEKIFKNNKQLFSINSNKYSITEHNTFNTTKNISHKNHDINSSNFIKKKLIPNKYRNLTLKEINLLNNNFNLNYAKTNFNSFFNTTINKEKDKNYSTIVYEKKKIKSPLNKNLKIHVKKNFKNTFNKNPINIVNININRNNNFIMNINNDHIFNSMANNKITNSSSKLEGRIRKFFSFQNFLNSNDYYKKNILKRMKNEKNNKEKKNNMQIFRKIEINKNHRINELNKH